MNDQVFSFEHATTRLVLSINNSLQITYDKPFEEAALCIFFGFGLCE